MSVHEQKRAINNQINELSRSVNSMTHHPAFHEGASVQDLLDMKSELMTVLENAVRIRRNAINFNETQTVERNKINIDNSSLLHALFRNIKLKCTLLRDMFLVYLRRNTSSLNSAQVDEIRQFLNNEIVKKLVGNTPHILPQVGSPVQRVQSPSAARPPSAARSPSAARPPSAARSPSAVQSPSAARPPSAARRYSNHRSSVILSPSAAANVFIRSISPPSARASQVVSPENVIVNESPQQPGCFGKMCKSIMSRFSNKVHPVGGKRKLRRRIRRTRRGRHSRLH
jgi:hypothetical protein